MSIAKGKILNEFIDKETAMKKLECSSMNVFPSIMSIYKVEQNTVDRRKYYKLSDIEEIIEKANDFFNKHYSCPYVVELFGYPLLNKYKIKSVTIPRKYRGILLQTRKEFKGATNCYEKTDIDKLKQKIEDINSNYLDRENTFKKLETTQDYIVDVVSKFNIRTKTNGNKTYYNIEDLQAAIEEVEKFYEEHYTAQYVYENIFSRDIVKARNVKQVRIFNHYKSILRKKYDFKGIYIFYKKADIDNISIKENEFIDSNSILKMFEIESDRFILKPVVKEFGIETMQTGNSLLYRLKDVKRVVEEVKNFFDTNYTRKQVSEIIDDELSY